MTSQPRQPLGARQDDVSLAGRYTHKTVPTINDSELELELGTDIDPVSAVGPPNDWTNRTVVVLNWTTTFARTVGTNDDGSVVVTVTSDCDPPDMRLLARKGDIGYWSGVMYSDEHREDRQAWFADIACRMLEEGLVATADSDNDEGIKMVMRGIVSIGGIAPTAKRTPHVLTAVVAQIRGLRLLQSITDTPLPSFDLRSDVNSFLRERFDDVLAVYKHLPKPPWNDTKPAGVPWGSQPIAGHATIDDGKAMFVGENSDLLWRALTEPTHNAMSPLKAAVMSYPYAPWHTEMIVAAALHDETAAEQLTTGLFDGIEPKYRQETRTRLLNIFALALDPSHDLQTGSGYAAAHRRHSIESNSDARCFTAEQQTRICGFMDMIETLEL